MKITAKIKNIIANPWVVRTSKTANGLLDIASKLGQTTMPGPLPKLSAGVSILETLVTNFEIEPRSALNEYVNDHKLIHVRSALGTCIVNIGATEQLNFEILAQTKTEALVGCVIDEEIFAVKFELGGFGVKPTNNCYYSAGFNFEELTGKLWKMLGEVAEITWNSSEWRCELVPGHLRESLRVDDSIQREIREEIQHYRNHNINYAALLYGPPGSGKTTFVHDLARANSLKILTIRPDVVDRFEPQSIEVIFDALRPGILLLDDVDRAEDGLVKLMSFLETIRDKYPEMVSFSTCNKFPDNSALLRPGRLGQMIEFTSPNDEEKKQLLLDYMKKYGTEGSFDINSLVSKMTHPYFSHDYVRMVAEKSLILNDEKLSRWTENLNKQLGSIYYVEDEGQKKVETSSNQVKHL